MKPVRLGLLIIAVGAIVSVLFGAQKKELAGSNATMAAEHVVIDPANLQWGEPPPGLPPGAKAVVLSGDPGKPGLFTVRMQAPPGYKIQPHTHTKAEQITVLSGTFHMGTGDKFDESAGHTMTAGSFSVMPAGMKHFVWFTEDSIIQVHAEGPFVITYVNPADDPRNAKK